MTKPKYQQEHPKFAFHLDDEGRPTGVLTEDAKVFEELGRRLEDLGFEDDSWRNEGCPRLRGLIYDNIDEAAVDFWLESSDPDLRAASEPGDTPGFSAIVELTNEDDERIEEHLYTEGNPKKPGTSTYIERRVYANGGNIPTEHVKETVFGAPLDVAAEDARRVLLKAREIAPRSRPAL
jgi:hypothetical protein